MSADQITHKLTIRCSGPLADFCHLIIFNGFNEIVAKDYGKIEIYLPRGLYRVRIEMNEENKEEMVRLDQDVALDLEPPPSYSSIVAENYNSSHEYYTYDAMHYSVQSTTQAVITGDQGSIFIFFRYPTLEISRELNARKTSLGEHFSILNENRQILYSLSGNNIAENLDSGWLAFHSSVRNGLYYLHYNGKQKREIPLYVFNGWQLQIFLTFREEPLFGTLRISTERVLIGFQNSNPVNYIMDASLQKLHNGIYFLPEKIMLDMATGNWQNPLVGLLAAYIYFKSGKKDKDHLFRQLLDNFDNIITEDKQSPDLIAIKILASKYFNEPVESLQLSAPCMFITGMKIAIELSVENIDVVKDDSIAEQAIEKLYTDMVWTSYDPPPIMNSEPSAGGSMPAPAPSFRERGAFSGNEEFFERSGPPTARDRNNEKKSLAPKDESDILSTSWVANSILSELSAMKTEVPVSIANLADILQVTPNIISKTISTILSEEETLLETSKASTNQGIKEMVNPRNMQTLKKILANAR